MSVDSNNVFWRENPNILFENKVSSFYKMRLLELYSNTVTWQSRDEKWQIQHCHVTCKLGIEYSLSLFRNVEFWISISSTNDCVIFFLYVWTSDLQWISCWHCFLGGYKKKRPSKQAAADPIFQEFTLETIVNGALNNEYLSKHTFDCLGSTIILTFRLSRHKQ